VRQLVGGSMKVTIAFAITIMMIISGTIVLLPSNVAQWSEQSSDRLTLRVPIQEDIKGLNPYAVNDIWSSYVIYRIWDGLVQRDSETQTNQPWIAVQWGFDDEQPSGCETCNITVEYKLGDWADKWGGSVYFHDGVKVTLDDVLFSYAMTLYNPRWVSSVDSLMWNQPWSDPPYGDPNFLKVTIIGKQGWFGIKKTNEHTLQFRLARPYSYFFDDTISVILFPKHVWEKHIDIRTGKGDYMIWNMDYNDTTGEASGMIGTSSFTFNEWKKGREISLNFNKLMFNWTRLPKVDLSGKIIQPERPAYNMSITKGRYLPYLNGIRYKIYHSDYDATLAMYEGEIDILVPPYNIPSIIREYLEYNSNIRTEHFKFSDPGFLHFVYNMRKRTFGYADPENGNYTDVGKPLRKAIAYISDREYIVSAALGDSGTVAYGPINPDNKRWYNPNIEKYRVNRTLAEKYLDDAGWKDTDGDGWRELPDIGDSPIEVLAPEVSYDPIRGLFIEMLATNAQSIGINLQVKHMEFGELISRLDRLDFDIAFFGWRIGGTDPGYLYNFYYCKSAQNYAGYCNATVDRLLDEIRQTSDIVKLIQLYKDIQLFIVDDIPNFFLYHPAHIETVVTSRFVGWNSSYGGFLNFWSLLFIHPPDAPLKIIFGNLPIHITSGKDVELEMRVSNPLEERVYNASITVQIANKDLSLRLKPGNGYPGNVSADGMSIAGKSNPNGMFKFIIASEPNYKEDQVVTLRTHATKYEYDTSAPLLTNVTVHKASMPWVQVAEMRIEQSTISIGETASVRVRVVDMDYGPVEGAAILFETEIGKVDPVSVTTDRFGNASTVISIPKDASADVSAFRISANVTANINGIELTAQRSLSVPLLQYTRPPVQNQRAWYEDPLFTFSCLMLVVTVVSGVILVYRFRRSSKRER
jgi:ABC-type transport system substrate-binding protein